MMQAVLPRAWRIEFERAAQDRREDIAHKEKMRRVQVMEREREEKNELREQERDDMATAGLVLASPEDVAAYRLELDIEATATVEVLMDNQEALDAVRGRIDAMLGEASVLPDGRRIFKTKDGQRVFDEHGQELSRELIDPENIDDTKPRWETFDAANGEHLRLTRERQELLDYQTKLDEARDRLDGGEITAKELDAMKAGLAADMPDAVREKLGRETAGPDSDLEREGLTGTRSVPAPLPNDMDALMRQTGLAPTPTP